MRRKDREITELTELLDVIRTCDVCRIAMNDEDGVPYIVPLNFGMTEQDGKISLHFHSALEGKKLDLIAKNPRVAFEMDTKHELEYFQDKGYCTYAYESVMGKGRIRILSEEDKFDSLTQLMEHYHPGENAYFNPAAMARTCVYCLDVEQITGKRKLPHHGK